MAEGAAKALGTGPPNKPSRAAQASTPPRVEAASSSKRGASDLAPVAVRFTWVCIIPPTFERVRCYRDETRGWICCSPGKQCNSAAQTMKVQLAPTAVRVRWKRLDERPEPARSDGKSSERSGGGEWTLDVCCAAGAVWGN